MDSIGSTLPYMHRLLLSESESGFSVVAWAVNGVILLMIVSVSAYCWYRNGCTYGYTYSSSTGISPSDLAYARVVLERQRLEEERRRGTPEQRAKRLRQEFQQADIIMTVQKEDIGKKSIDTDDGDDDSSSPSEQEPQPHGKDATAEQEPQGEIEKAENAEESTNKHEPDIETGWTSDSECFELSYLVIPNVDPPRKVPGTCAICLCRYEPDDRVVWSKNENCCHAFHEDCMVDWLVNVREGAACPCCREEFIPPQILDFQKKQTSIRSTFDAFVGFFR